MVPQIIDISSNNGNVNFEKIKAAGISEIFIRTSMGFGAKDKNCLEYANKASAAGLPVNYYHFSYPDKKMGGTVESDANSESDYFADTIQKMPKFTRIAVDCERFNATSDTPLNPQEYYKWLSTFLDHIYSRTGVTPLLYATSDYLNHRLPPSHDIQSKCNLWLAQYNSSITSPVIPHGFKSYLMWQYSDKCSVAGGIFDGSRFNPSNI